MPKRKKVADPREEEVTFSNDCITLVYPLFCSELITTTVVQDSLSTEQSRIKHTEMLNSSFFRCEYLVCSISCTR